MLAIESASGTNWVLQDHLGSTRALVSSAGVLVQSIDYDSFGKAIVAGSLSTRYLYTGRELDAESGLFYYRARYYDSSTGRFTNEDPIGFAGGSWNTQIYVDNSPISAIDPMGLTVILGIHSNTSPTGGFTSGHAWISVTDTNSGTMNTYGLWPDDHPLVTDNGPLSDVRTDMEKAYTPADYNRYRELTDAQAKRLAKKLSKNDSWSYWHTCADWARDTYNDATGEDIDADDYFGFETPREISGSISRKNSSPRK